MKNQKTFKQYDRYDNLNTGDQVILLHYTNEMTSEDWYRAIPDSGEGIPGNLNHEIKRYHGWRGTTNNIRCEALGSRKILKISDEIFPTQNSRENAPYRKLTVGPDLKADEE